MRKGRKWKRLLSVILAASVINTTLCSSVVTATGNPQSGESVVYYDAENNTEESLVQDNGQKEKDTSSSADSNDTAATKDTSNAPETSETDNTKNDGSSDGEKKDSAPTTTDSNDTQKDKNEKDISNLYENGQIKIYNLDQLKAVGTGAEIHEGDAQAETFGTGETLTDEEGNALTYAADGTYTLMNDIALDSADIWQLPDGFAGSFSGTGGSAESKLYDAETDTIYVYNNYQLATINDPEALKTVMSNDMIAEDFGMGQIVFADEAKETQLEYTAEHNYVLTTEFTSEMPELKAAEVHDAASIQLGGREFIGQSAMQIDGETYILIGNEQQLRAIGEEVETTPGVTHYRSVVPMLFERTGTTNHKYKPVYPGDADLNISNIEEAGLSQEITGQVFDGESFDKYTELIDEDNIGDGTTATNVGTWWVVSVDENQNKKIIPATRFSGEDQFVGIYRDLRYTSDANYIIFRDIDLKEGTYSDGQNNNWKPLMFSGNMIGSENMAGIDVDTGTIDKSGIDPVEISNITVNKSGEIDLESDPQGAGFFGTIGSLPGEDDNILMSKGQVTVTGLNLKNVDVRNTSTEVEHDPGLLDGLLGGVGWLLGLLLELFGIDSVSDLADMLLNGMDANPSMFAAGSFAGSVAGQVEITNCSVENAKVQNAADRTGGFIGDIQGKTLYTLQEVGQLVKVLAGILNMLPFLGLGNVVDVLLNGGILKLDQIVPAGYVAPVIKDCTLTNVAQDTLGSETTSFNGGFAGRIEGGILQNIKVTQDTNLEIKGNRFVGGFAGSIANTEVKGLLTELDIDVMEAIFSQAAVTGVNVDGNGTISVSSVNKTNGDEETAARYTGGFSGYIASSYVIDCSIKNLGTVSSAGDYTGGFTGYTSPGASITLNEEYTGETKVTLLDDVLGLLKRILAGEHSEMQALLSLVGISPAYIYGCEASGKTGAEITGNNYVGGFAGRADGTQFGTSSPEQLAKLDPIKDGKVSYTGNGAKCQVGNISLVQGTEGYSGGFIGYAAPASMAGILDSTVVGVANVVSVKIGGAVIQGNAEGLTVRNTNGVAAGGIGAAVGTEISNVTVENIKAIESKNDAAGFIGRAGVGNLVSGGGLDILGLIKLNSLVSLAPAVPVKAKNVTVSGMPGGFTVYSTGEKEENVNHRAGGFIAQSGSAQINNSSVTELKKVSVKDMENGYAGGFIGVSVANGLADLADDNNEGTVSDLISISDLITAIPYLMPEYENCDVVYVNDIENYQVEAACAGGFAGKLESGTVDNSEKKNIAVKNICNVHGKYYAGGFAGIATSGGLASSRGGVNLLGTTINASQLLQVLPLYIPKITNAGVDSESGLTVTSDGQIGTNTEKAGEGSEDDLKQFESNSGSAGGYLGYGSGVQISGSNVNKLRNTTVKEPEDLQQKDGSSYFDKNSYYAVKAAQYAGGYVGKLDIGNAAAVGNGLGLIDQYVLDLTDALSILAAVSSSIETSDVTGDTGGYAVLANGVNEDGNKIGHAGGYAGSVNGSLIKNSDAHNFAYIIGQETAGGYVGNMEPGSVAEVIGDVDVIGGLVTAENVASLLQTFIPRIISSSTDAVPCGGVVRAESPSCETGSGGILLRGAAGGYAGHNNGGRIEGESTDNPAKAERIRSVYGYEYAGGFTGYLHNADLVDTGSISVLFGLIKINNPLSAIQAVYATETNTSVTGPLRGLSYERFKQWYNAVGIKGPYKDQFAGLAGAGEENYNKQIAQYYYGYQVTAGRDELEQNAEKRAGTAGGYVGKMVGSQIENAHAYDLQKVEAMRSAGGFAGETGIGALADVGGISLGDLDLTSGLIPALQTFVPVIKTSSVDGYVSGAEICATGYSEQENNYVGNAGGFVGYLLGGTILGTEDSKCGVHNLKTVDGKQYAGGFAGLIMPGSLLTVDSSSEDGLLEELLEMFITTPSDLASVLNATLSRVTYSEVTGLGSSGFTVGGMHKEGNEYKYAKAAGGYVGMIQGGIIGAMNDANAGASVTGVRTVTAGEYAGGFMGLGDVSAVAEVSSGGTNILGQLLGLGALDALDAFRTYVYDSSVTGADAGGLAVSAKEGELKESQQDGTYKVYSGNAGGFAGTLLNGTIKDSSVTELKLVEAVNYGGGFIGHSGKSGAVDLDKVGIIEGAAGNLLGADLGVADVCGSTINDSDVAGIAGGYTVKSENGDGQIAGGFIGYGDLARMDRDTARNLKQVSSGGTAGGFIGQTSYAYLVDAGINSELLDPVLNVVLALVNYLLPLDEMPEDGSTVTINVPGLIEVKALYHNGVLSVNLLGLEISVELGDLEDDGSRQVKINIGDSSVTIKATDDKVTEEEIQDVVRISLIKANRTRVAECNVTGIASGYDVFGAGATNDSKGSGKGYTGGFVGNNDEGLFKGNNMYQADTVKGAPDQIGEFSGNSTIDSNYTNLQDIEGDNNHYFVYRMWDTDGLTELYTQDQNTHINDAVSNTSEPAVIGETEYYCYSVLHMQHEKYGHEDLWNGAYQSTANKKAMFAVNVYVSDAQADLMLGTPTYANETEPEGSESEIQDPCDVNGEHTIQKIWKDDNNSSGTRPDSITVKVKQDGKIYNPVTENENNPITMTDEMAGSDPDVWTTTIDAPIYETENDKYKYTVEETPILNEAGDQIYATIYKDLDEYTHQIINYLPTELVKEDTVVIDFGLSVDIDVLTNDTNVGGKLAGVNIKNTTEENSTEENSTEKFDTTLLNKVTNKLDDSFSTEAVWKETLEEGQEQTVVRGDYGTAQIKGDDIRFTPTTMSMSSYQQIMYAVQLPDNNKTQQYVYSKVTVVPATTIYYEDDFNQTHNKQPKEFTTGINYVDGKVKESEELTDEEIPVKNIAVWQIAKGGSESDTVQDTDRPGSDAIGRAWDDWYGNDTHYEDDLKYSNGSSHYVEVNADNQPKKGGTFPYAEFTFQGTGFDVISVTSGGTGRVNVEIRKESEEGDLVKRYITDTYYGYKYIQDENGQGAWVEDSKANEDNALYQVPILKVENLEYGQYYVKVIPEYYASDAHNDAKSYKVYLDAIRVYNPANEKNPNPDEYKVIEGVYQQDGEQQPRFTELRDILLNAENVSEVPQFGTVFVDGNDNLADIGQYEDFGPKNEIYLKKGQAISFYLWSDYIPDKVQLSAKLARGTATNLTVGVAVKESDQYEESDPAKGWKYYKIDRYPIKTAYDLYYDFADQCIWEEAEVSDGTKDGETPFRTYKTKYPIVIGNSAKGADGKGGQNEDGILSLTNLKWTGDQVEGTDSAAESDVQTRSLQTVSDENDLIATASWDNVEAAYYFINTPVQATEHTVTVHYMDQNGKKLADSQVITGAEGSSYDVTEAAGKEIAGYEIVEVQGEVTGTLDSDVEITVIYQPKTYTLRVEYVDQAGLTLADPYVQENIAHGTEYDVTAQTEKEFEGYRLVGTAGGFLQGTMENDVTIRVIYEKQTFDLAVYYIDGEGNEIADPYIWENVAYGTAYDLTEQTEKQIDGYTLQQVSGDEATGILSGDVVIHVVYAKAEAAVPMTYTVLVRYTDKDGNSLADPYFIKDLEKGSAYDVEAQTEKEIDGYTFYEVKGDAVSGEADCNKVITVVYLKNYSIQLNYKDQDGNVLADPYMTEAPEGSHYDLSEQVEKKFEGYQLVGTAGGFIEGTLESDLTINVIYEKLTYSIIVNYVDQDGNVLADPYVKTEVPYGTAYDVSEMTGREIDGYTAISVTGDPEKGTVSGNVILNVVYEKEQAEEPKPTYSVIVNYIDKNGNVLAQPYVQAGLTEGSSYDVTAETEKQIDGYTLAEIKGDAVSGTVDSNRVINVVYLQNYTVTVTYEGNDGKVLADPYVITGTDGSAYDVTEQTQRQFEGYSLDRIAGDDVSGVLDQNKEIRVEYLQQTFSITVFYKDRAGNDLAEPYIKADVPYGTAYDVTAEADKEIDGYEAADICGSPVTGTITQPVAVTVIYDKKEAEQPEKPVTYSVVVNYLDKSGNALAESYVQDNVAEGTKYNVSLQAGRFIDGYTLAGVIGDAVYGTVDGNKVINVIYLKNYQVTVRYLDEDNNDLADPYVYEAVEGSIYNVSQHAALEIEGYELDELRGQPVWGILDDNKIVIVKYTKAEETPAPGGDDQNPTDPDDSDEQNPSNPGDSDEQYPSEPDDSDEQEPTEPDDPEDQKPSEPENPDDQQPSDPDKQDPAEPENSGSQGSSDQGNQDVQNPADSSVNDTVDKPSSGIENADAQDSNNSAAETDRAVETGDTSNIFLPVAGMAIALLAVAAVVIYRKKNMKK